MKTSRYGSKNRFQIMPYEQILRLFRMLSDQLMICCEINSDQPLIITLWDIITEMKTILMMENILVKDIRLIGGAATYVISCSDSFSFKDIDIVFSLESCNNLDIMDKIRFSVLTAIKQLMSKCTEFKDRDCCPERYIKKQVCVQNQDVKDYWSLFCLGSCTGLNSDIVELKFATSIERQYECSVDSFQIVLDPVLYFIDKCGIDKVTKDLYPTVVSESVWGSIQEALDHLQKKHIVIENPEKIRGGGLLKYCKLLVEGFTAHPKLDVTCVEKYMCSRFFIDFPLLSNQQEKILSYLVNHFPPDHRLHLSFLQHLSQILTTSSVFIGPDRLRSVFLINSMMDHIWTLFSPKISVNEFNDRDKWSVDQIFVGSCQCSVEQQKTPSSSSSSISTPTALSQQDQCYIDGDDSSSHEDGSSSIMIT